MGKTNRPKKILLIEDDPTQVFMYRSQFEMDGFVFLSAPNGEEGLALADKEIPDIILLDILMGKLGGMETLEILKKDSPTKIIPVFILTNFVKQEIEQQARQLGAEEYIIKSQIMPKEISKMIKKRFEKQ